MHCVTVATSAAPLELFDDEKFFWDATNEF